MTEAKPSGNTSIETDREKIHRIRQVIRESGDRWRCRYPVLANNNLMGMGIFITSVLGILVSAFLYLNGILGALPCVLIVAFLTSLLHELEHDLIHWQYFKRNKFIHNLMMLGVWLFRPGTINPWIRRHLHFLHHKTSGTEKDIEERGIGNGLKYSPLRWWIMLDPVCGNICKILLGPETRKPYRIARLIAAYFPFGILTVAAWYLFLAFHILNGVSALVGTPIVWDTSTLEAMVDLEHAVVIFVAPHYLRSFCLIFISSSMHYYGNVDSLLKQTQVLNAWYFLPLQLFCFNFGSTHGIHHFVVDEPFYIRQLTVKDAHKVMRGKGVPFNDLGTFVRQNRYQPSEEPEIRKGTLA